MPRVATTAETSRLRVDPPAPTDSTPLIASAVGGEFFASTGATVRAIGLARFTDKLSLVRLSPAMLPPGATTPPNPDAYRIDHVLAIVVVGYGPPPLVGGSVEAQPPPVRRSEPVVAALNPVTGQLLWEAWTSDGSISLALVTR
jgi:hypothetical protein